MSQTLIGCLIEHLEQKKRRQQHYVPLSKVNQRFLKQIASAKDRSNQGPGKVPAPAPAATVKAEAESTAAEVPKLNLNEASAPYQANSEAAAPALDLSGSDWAEVSEKVMLCERCKLCKMGRSQTVFGVGNREADIMFIGEGPGAEEDRLGEPFVGAAGKLLTKIINAMGLERSDVYIANIIKCRPPNNRNPEDDEALSCLPYLERQIGLVQPKVIVLLGAVPLKYLLKTRGIMRHRGKWMSHGDISVMPTYHPAFLIRKPEHKREAWEDMQAVMKKIGLERPEK